MKKLISFLAFTTIFASCGKNNEEYLYNKYDDDYSLTQAMAAKKCESETPILTELQKTNLFDTFFTDSEKTKLFTFPRKAVDGNNKTTITTSVLIERSDADPTATMNIYVSSSAPLKNEQQHFKFEYKRVNNSDLLATIVIGTCSSDKKLGTPTFAASWMRFNPSREKKLDDNNFTKKTESVTVKAGYPIVISMFGQAETFHSKETGLAEVKWSYETAAMAEVKCSENLETCNAVKARADVKVCDLKVNKDFTNSSNPDYKLTEFQNCGNVIK
jgi:hypothetical protein